MYSKNQCVHCYEPLAIDAKFCKKCGTIVPAVEANRCENPRCKRNNDDFEFDSEDMYCDQCGKPTSLGRIVEANI